MKKILIINGPNLNLLGNREDDIYGKDSLDKIKSDCEKKGIEKKLEIIFFQSNNEGEIICLLYTSPSPRDPKISRMPSSA